MIEPSSAETTDQRKLRLAKQQELQKKWREKRTSSGSMEGEGNDVEASKIEGDPIPVGMYKCTTQVLALFKMSYLHDC